ncbi:MAG: hypothetical protein K9L85_00895 [Candidatus Peribacteraceae bacterium]|nr:hypothetical protein [Candidatus Peribacteraceae bacterium]
MSDLDPAELTPQQRAQALQIANNPSQIEKVGKVDPKILALVNKIRSNFSDLPAD